MLDSADVTPLDGRVARSRRTRAAIVEALVELLEAGNPQPTVEEIARAPASRRAPSSEHYADREAPVRRGLGPSRAHLQALWA